MTTAAQDEMFYIIGDTVQLANEIELFDYLPAEAVANFGFTISYAVSIPAGTPTISTLAVDSGFIVVGDETDTSLFGSHTVRLTATMDDFDQGYRSDQNTSEYVDFTLNMIKLEGNFSD